MRELMATFPRQLAYPERKLCHTSNQFYNLANKYNGVKNRLYFSLYSCDHFGSFENSNIDKVSFDLDSENALQNVKKISDHCMLYNLRHCIIFSTGGFWVHILSDGDKLKNPKQALKNAQLDIVKKLGFTVGTDAKKDDVDFHILGDVSRVSRLVGSLDIRRRLYCVSLQREQLTNMEDIRKFARKQNFKIHWYGELKINLHIFDEEKVIVNHNIPESPHLLDLEPEEAICMLPLGIRNWLLQPFRAKNKVRFFFTVICRELGLSAKTCDNLAKKYWSQTPDSSGRKTKYQEFVEEGQLEYVYNKHNSYFPSSTTLKKMGLLKDGEEFEFYK